MIAVDGISSEQPPYTAPSRSTFTIHVGKRHKIVFTSNRDGNNEIYTMDKTGAIRRA